MIEDHRISPVELRYLLSCLSQHGVYDWSASVEPRTRVAVVERMVALGLVKPGQSTLPPQVLTAAGHLYIEAILSTPLPKETTRWEIPARPAVSMSQEGQYRISGEPT